MPKLHQLNDEEREIFKMARAGNIDAFTNYYLRNESSGTIWLPGAKRDPWKTGYERLHKYWVKLGKPEKFAYKDTNQVYQCLWEHETSGEYPEDPAFHYNHGFLLLPYGKELHKDRHFVRTVIGGVGSGKTLNQVASMLVEAAIYPEYRGWIIAPLLKQAAEGYRLAKQIYRGTLYEKRFVIKAPATPLPYIMVGNSEVGETVIECLSLGKDDKRSNDILTLTADRAYIDQAELIENLSMVVMNISSRFRGRTMMGNRARIGTLTLVANSADNQELWDIFDQAEDDPKNYISFAPTSYDNPYLTERDIERYEVATGGDKEMLKIKMLGQRPTGNGKEFSAAVIDGMRSKLLDEQMQAGLDENRPGFIRVELPKIGVSEWMLPYQEGREYLVMSDPGTAKPPGRNSPCILVWDITEFSVDSPASLVAFLWFDGKGDISTWANRYVEMVYRYKAITSNGFDATGFQAGYDELMYALKGVMPDKINLSGNAKSHCLNAAKMFAAMKLLQFPSEINGLSWQLSRYDILEDSRSSKMRQDIAITFMMSAWWMQRLFYIGKEEEKRETAYQDRYSRPLTERVSPRARAN